MSKLSIYENSWLDLVFEGRNKEYGAYQLRQQNPRTTLKALFFGTLICVSLVSIPILSNLLKKDTAIVTDPVYELPKIVSLNLEKLPEVKPEKKEATAQPEKSSVKEKKHVIPIITNNTTTTTEIPVLDLKEPIKTGAVDNPGDGSGAITLGQGTLDGTGKKPVDEIPEKGNDDNTIVNNFGLDASPEFPGGIKRFLELVGSKFKTPADMEAGVISVNVAFVVEKDGSLSDIKVMRDPGYGLGNEAIRVLKSIKTKWSPGIQNKKPVRTAFNLPIKVRIN